MALEGLAADVNVQQVHALLLARTPSILEPTSDDHSLYEAEVQGITTEVVAVAGPTPTGAYRDLALRAITVGVAAQLEFGLFPEQQLGDTARGRMLQERYERLLGQLGGSDGAAGEIPAVARPIGDFPEPDGYAEFIDPWGSRYVPRYGD